MNHATHAPFAEAVDDPDHPETDEDMADQTVTAGSKFFDIPSFVETMSIAVGQTASTVRMRETKRSRILRRFISAEVAECLGCDRTHLYNLTKHPSAPQGEQRGRETTYSVEDILRLRALNHAPGPVRKSRKRFGLQWRRSEKDPLPVVTFCSQKGGTAKTLSCAHFAQAMQLQHGLRVLVVDGDPQSTCSLYFVDQSTSIGDMDTMTFADFMGVPSEGDDHSRIHHDPETLDDFMLDVPWPGIRLVPGGASIQAAEIEIVNMATSAKSIKDRRVHTMLRENIQRWARAHPPKTQPEDLFDEDGQLDLDKLNEALTETVDLIVIDSAPALTLTQFNLIYAADMLVIPQTMKGFDLAALHAYLVNLNDYFSSVQDLPNAAKFAQLQSFVLPTIVNQSSDTDIRSIGELMALNVDGISPVYYAQSDGAANAFREFQSAYEYEPDKNRKSSISRFVKNANAVNDAIAIRALPHLPPRGYANEFIQERYPDNTIPMWTADAAPIEEENT